MFSQKTYLDRRTALLSKMDSGIIVIPGNREVSMNFEDNWYHFRQDSTFLYYCGLQNPDLFLVMDIESEKTVLFGQEVSIDDVIWSGPQPTLADRAMKSGVSEVKPVNEGIKFIKNALSSGRKVHALPDYRPEHKLFWSEKVGWGTFAHSEILLRNIIGQRNIKTPEEIEEMHRASTITAAMHEAIMKTIRPGMFEFEVRAKVTQIAMELGGELSFPVIATINGHILHNHYYHNELQEGRLLILDCGAETKMGYAGDRTSTIPVASKFSSQQKDVYNTVLNGYNKAVSMLKPGISYKEVHLQVAKVLASGLKEMGLMKGNLDDAVENGAHALFMPHGLGHMLGLDVHDMENFGEDLVGYDEKYVRSQQFGLRSLRLGRELEEGYVLTVEPGIYLIPELIKKWKSEKINTEFIDFSALESFSFTGGVRIEDDYLIEANSGTLLGEKLPRTINEIEDLREEALS